MNARNPYKLEGSRQNDRLFLLSYAGCLLMRFGGGGIREHGNQYFQYEPYAAGCRLPIRGEVRGLVVPQASPSFI
jgi:hypothetical protein